MFYSSEVGPQKIDKYINIYLKEKFTKHSIQLHYEF